MTREEQIFEASKTYSEYEDNQTIYENGFINGAEWADSNPISKWISVNEKLPPEQKDGLSIKVIVACSNGKIDLSRYDHEMGGWISPVSDVIFTHWMRLPELPK